MGGWTLDRWAPPSEAYVAGTNVGRFMARHGVGDLRELERRAAEDREWFYPRALEAIGFEFPEGWHQLVDESAGPEWATWFAGARTNVCEQVRRRWSGHEGEVALTWESEDGVAHDLTYAELEGQVRRLAFGLRSLGVGVGDTVGLCLPMAREAAVAMLAIVAIGAIACPIFTGYGPGAMADRISLSGCAVVVTARGYRRRGKDVQLLDRVEAAVAEVAHPVSVVSWPDGGDLSWDEACGRGELEGFELFDVATPYCLAFTSGSTGKPKAAVHTHGGLPVKFALELHLSMDLREGDRLLWVTDMGWGAGPNSLLGTLLNRATYCMYESVPDHPDAGRLWELVEAHGLTHLGITPTITRTLAAAGDRWVPPDPLATLRVLISTAEPWTTPAWRWLHQVVGREQVPIINFTGGTEVGGGILVGSPVVTTPGGRFSGVSLGMRVDAVDDDGNPVLDAPGELVIRGSSLGMTKGLWREPERYLDSYWRRFPGCWEQGDRAIHHSDGTWSLIGRSDEVLKIAGKRIGPTELESVATECEGVTAAAAVSLHHPEHGTRAVLAVQVEGEAGDEVVAEVTARIEDRMGRAMRPTVVAVAELPVTATLKVHRRAVRAWLAGEDAGDLSTIENPSAEAALRAAGAGLR